MSSRSKVAYFLRFLIVTIVRNYYRDLDQCQVRSMFLIDRNPYGGGPYKGASTAVLVLPMWGTRTYTQHTGHSALRHRHKHTSKQRYAGRPDHAQQGRQGERIGKGPCWAEYNTLSQSTTNMISRETHPYI